MKILVTGATGLIGREIGAQLKSEGHSVVAMTRDRLKGQRLQFASDVIEGDLQKGPVRLPQDIDAVIHLMGESVADGRWTEEKKKSLRDSRILATQNLHESLKDSKLKIVVGSSAIGYYGNRGDEEVNEGFDPGTDFLAQLCVEWENVVAEFKEKNIRHVSIRTGLVLAKDGGILPTLLTPFKLGLGGRIGDGRSWMSWIHINDVVGIYLHALKNNLSGALNATAPQPVRNEEFTNVLGKVLSRPALVPIPALALRAVFGEKAQMIMASQKVMPKKTLESGYSFQFTDLETALRSLL